MILRKMMGLLACSVAVCSADWPTYHGDASLSGMAKTKLPKHPQLRWRFNAGGAVTATPVSDGKRIYFTSKKGRVTALDVDGSDLWTLQINRKNDAGQDVPERLDAPLVCSEGVLVVAAVRGVAHGLDAASGKPLWSYDTGGVLVGSPNVMDDLVILLDQSEGVLHAVDIHTGLCRWKSEGIERCDGVPGIGKDHMVFGSCLAAFHVFSKEGTHLQDIEVGGEGQVAGGVAVLGSHAFGGTRDGGLLCVDLKAGEIIWSSDESEEPTFTTPAVSQDRVVYASDNGFIYCVDRADGTFVWAYDTEGLPYSAVIAGDKVLAVADGVLFLLRLDNGEVLWSREISDEITAPAIIDGMIVVGADDGTISGWGWPLTARDSNVYE